MACTALDGERADPPAERNLTAYRAPETAGLLRGIDDHAVQVAHALDRANQNRSTGS